MKPQNNDLKGLCFSVIIIAAVALTYAGSFGFPDASDSNAWERLAAIPAMVTVYILMPHMDTGYLIVGWMGSVVIYFGIGVAILLAIQSLIKKYGGKKGKNNRI